MIYTYRTQTLNEFTFDAAYAVFFNGTRIGSATSETGAHLVIIRAMMRGIK